MRGGLCINQEQRNKLKVSILETGLDKRVAKASRQLFAHKDESLFHELYQEVGPQVIKTADNLNHAKWKRRERIENRVGYCVSLGDCLFLTLTFNAETMKSTTPETRRKYVRRYLKSQCVHYVANIDYGNNGIKRKYKDSKGVERESQCREHYHALVFAAKMDFKKWHKYGSILAEKVNSSKVDEERVVKYVSKLTNHAMKMNDGIAPRLIYSRSNKREIAKLFEDLF